VLLSAIATAFAEQPSPAPDFSAITLGVEAYFAAAPGYKAGDLISHRQVAGALDRLKNDGFEIAAAEEILQLTLPDNSFLVTRLATPAGRRFMRKISDQPGAYARLDRLSSISRGQKLVNDLIRQKGGDELIRYLATDGGRHLGQQLGAIPGGVNINKPTGRIYTVDDLLAALKRAI
jgi:hypothetical protein